MLSKPQLSPISSIGAGRAGLTAAYRLQEKGYDVQVYEARHRPGGRVLTAKIGESYGELGGQNLCDAGEPYHSTALLRDLGLESLSHELPFRPLFVNGTRVIPSFEIFRKIKNPETLEDTLEKIAAHASSIQEVINAAFEDPDARLLFTGTMRNYEGSDPCHLDVATIDSLYTLCAGSLNKMKEADAGRPPIYASLTVKGGNGKLPLALSQQLKYPIQYGQVLTALHQEGQGVTLTFNKAREVQTDLVLLALPCSMFADIDFRGDAIPQETLARIHTIQYGTNAKILFSCPPLTNPHDVFQTPTLISWPNETNDIRTLYCGGELGICDAQKAHTFFRQGKDAIHRAYPHLSIPFHPLEAAQDNQFISYQGSVFKSWALDTYAKGSYTNRAPGTAAWLSDVEIIKGEKVRPLFRPINDKIFFAGEHTTALESLGTMEGAIESGERMARLINVTCG